jgi:uncharacterized protein
VTRRKARENRQNVSPKYWIEKLRLEPHPEGGYFRQTYKSELLVAPTNSRAVAQCATGVGQPEIPYDSQPASRAASTAIYFLLAGDNFSAFHRLRSDEMWHFYAGSPLLVHVIDAAGGYSSILLGNDPDAHQVLQAVVKAGCWFASELARNPHFFQNRGELRHPSWSLVGCTVAPGFEFEDLELAKREELACRFPRHRQLIGRLTRQ